MSYHNSAQHTYVSIREDGALQVGAFNMEITKTAESTVSLEGFQPRHLRQNLAVASMGEI